MANITFDYTNKQIVIAPDPITSVDPISITILQLRNVIRNAETSDQGMLVPTIASASGRNQLSTTTTTALTLQLLGWQVKFIGSNYLAQVEAGNLIGGINGDPFADHPSISVLNILSQSATVVDLQSGSVWTEQQRDTVLARTPEVIADTVLDRNV